MLYVSTSTAGMNAECKSNKINLTPSSMCIRIQTTLTLQQIWHFSHTCQTQYNMCTLEYICAQKARLHAHTPIYDICAWEREQALQWNVIMLSYLSKKNCWDISYCERNNNKKNSSNNVFMSKFLWVLTSALEIRKFLFHVSSIINFSN